MPGEFNTIHELFTLHDGVLGDQYFLLNTPVNKSIHLKHVTPSGKYITVTDADNREYKIPFDIYRWQVDFASLVLKASPEDLQTLEARVAWVTQYMYVERLESTRDTLQAHVKRLLHVPLQCPACDGEATWDDSDTEEDRHSEYLTFGELFTVYDDPIVEGTIFPWYIDPDKSIQIYGSHTISNPIQNSTCRGIIVLFKKGETYNNIFIGMENGDTNTWIHEFASRVLGITSVVVYPYQIIREIRDVIDTLSLDICQTKKGTLQSINSHIRDILPAIIHGSRRLIVS